MQFNPVVIFVYFLLMLMPLLAAGQKKQTGKSASVETQAMKAPVIDPTIQESNAIIFKSTGVSLDTTKATLKVRVREKEGDALPIQGATVLLRRDKDQMLGRVTTYDGRCLFSSTPATYTVRVQMTGLKSVEKSGYVLDAGQSYDMEIFMTKH